MNTKHRQNIPLSEAIRGLGRNQPHVYRIMVAGSLDPDWSDRLGGLRIESLSDDVSTPDVTVLEGFIRDQAQLSGVLNSYLPMASYFILGSRAREVFLGAVIRGFYNVPGGLASVGCGE